MEYTDDARYLPGETTLEIGTVNKPRERDAQFLQSRSSSSTREISSFIIFSLQALRTAFLRY